MKAKLILVAVLLLVVLLAFVAGRSWPRRGTGQPSASAAASPQNVTYTCPMHPQIRQGEMGRCPICGMELVPAPQDDDGGSADGLPRLRVSARAAALMNVQTWPVERRHVAAERRFLGKVVYDETRLFDIVTRVEGQIERLFLNYAGVPVRKGEHIAEFFSPEFLSTTQELLLSRPGGEGSTGESARQRLRLLGISEEQIADVLRTGKPRDTFTLFSPVSGVLKELDGRQGIWRMKGERLAQIADISTVWVVLDAYESDLPLVHYGQQVQLEVAALPGRQFTGFVAFIAPELDERTRTVKVRLNVPNPDGALRPGMFARARLEVPLTAAGRAYGPELAGKWICPMHPENVGEAPGSCSICGMPLEPAEKLGHVRAEDDVTKPLVIPASAPLVTGQRAVVYVKKADGERPTFEGRQVTLGPRAGNFYIVHSGLSEGEQVVTEGNFKIDSELQLRGLPSMMAPGEAAPASGAGSAQRVEVPAGFSERVAELARAYLRMSTALAADDAAGALAVVKDLEAPLTQLDNFDLEAAANREWLPVSRGLHGALHAIAAAKDIEVLRQHFEALSAHMETAVVRFGAGQAGTLYRAFCPMAFNDRGASWLQADKRIANPYFGASMLRCGEIQDEIGMPPAKQPPANSPNGSAGHRH